MVAVTIDSLSAGRPHGTKKYPLDHLNFIFRSTMNLNLDYADWMDYTDLLLRIFASFGV